MDDESLRYDIWIEEALRGVIRRTLAHVARHGIDGDHHYYITFTTGAPGVSMPRHLADEHPDEMTIVLQHQFSDLAIAEDAFAVTLSFGGKAEHLHIPFDAVTSFADPSVNFGLQLKMIQVDFDGQPDGGEQRAGMPGTAAAVNAPKTAEVITLDSFRKK